MKSVLISIKPYWVFLIIAETMGWNIGKQKTVEIRKVYPKVKSWDNVAKIYCSKDKMSFAQIPKEYQPLMNRFLGKVIGEFVCDKIERIEIRHFTVFGHENRYTAVGENPDYQWLAHSCLKYNEVVQYGKTAPLYGWHISELVVYDTPKQLTDFCAIKKCNACKESGYESSACIYDEDCKVPAAITRPPQSWCYVAGR